MEEAGFFWVFVVQWSPVHPQLVALDPHENLPRCEKLARYRRLLAPYLHAKNQKNH